MLEISGALVDARQPAAADVWKDKYLRLHADLENTKKRLARSSAHEVEAVKEALLRDVLSVAGIDRTVKLDIPPETRNGRVFRLRGLGMPKMKQPDQRGDLYVTVEAILPQNLTTGEQELVEQWRNMR